MLARLELKEAKLFAAMRVAGLPEILK